MEFRNAILQKQESASKILIGKEGLESRKLNYLIQLDYKRAMSVIDSQEIAFNTLIREITDLDPDRLPTGAPAQTGFHRVFRGTEKTTAFRQARDRTANDQQECTRR